MLGCIHRITYVRHSMALFLVAWLFGLAHLSAGEHRQPLGRLEPFWRFSAALGPHLEYGAGLRTIPDFWLRGDFPYRKRPFAREVPFADHLSVVRLLGGYGTPAAPPDEALKARDLAYRAADGTIRYRMELVRPRLKPYLDAGYQDFTVVLDNMPWCFPEKPILGGYGQSAPPRDPREWQAFITELCRELVRILGPEGAQRLRFRVGTEANGRDRFAGTQEEFLRHYDASAAAVRAIIPTAGFGPYNLIGAQVDSIATKDNVNTFALAAHCAATGQPFDFVAFSSYPWLGTDPVKAADDCRAVWESFGQRVPSMRQVPREIHEFGVGKMNAGRFESEPGAHGGALTAQMLFRLRAAGCTRMWHWSMSGFESQAWLLSVLEQAAGSDAWLLTPSTPAKPGAHHLGMGCFTAARDILVFSAYHQRSKVHTEETVRFTIPRKLLTHATGTVRHVILDRQTAVYDRMRQDLAAADLLAEEFVKNPERLSGVRTMGAGKPAEQLVDRNEAAYERQWVESLTLKPLPTALGRIETTATDATIILRLAPPAVCVLVLTP